MVDVVDKATRSRMMSGIRSKNTKPEILIRSALHRRGFRFRLNQASLPGKPDLVFRRFNAVIFIHGCFWHGHNCELFKWPSSNAAFWRNKIERNRAKDNEVIEALKVAGWRVMVIWECAIKGKAQMNKFPYIVDRICTWLLRSNYTFKEISGSAAAWHRISG
jgi:DNA mismatch endonuclease (patch repair protein)